MPPGAWGWDEEEPSPRDAELVRNARNAYDMIAKIVVRTQLEPRSFVVTPGVACEMHAIATAGETDPRKQPGVLRSEDVQIGRAVALYVPPRWQNVPGLMDDACSQIEQKRAARHVIHAAAYALWRINWIHPFADGNGKTSRLIMYAVLCTGFGRMIPGEIAIPDQIARNPYRYWDALKAADRAWQHGALDVFEIETMLADLLDQALSSAHSA
jgi:Fic family protein